MKKVTYYDETLTNYFASACTPIEWLIPDGTTLEDRYNELGFRTLPWSDSSRFVYVGYLDQLYVVEVVKEEKIEG